jgi:hypothetical protein
MTEVESLVLDHLRYLRREMDGLRADVRDIKTPITSLERKYADLHGDFANQSLRLDRLEQRLERVEHQLNLSPAERLQ